MTCSAKLNVDLSVTGSVVQQHDYVDANHFCLLLIEFYLHTFTSVDNIVAKSVV